MSKGDPPFLIFHGTADPLVPFNQSERLAKALKDAGVECYFVPVEGAGHGGFRSPEVPKRIRQFFDKHLRDQSTGAISEAPIPNEGTGLLGALIKETHPSSVDSWLGAPAKRNPPQATSRRVALRQPTLTVPRRPPYS